MNKIEFYIGFILTYYYFSRTLLKMSYPDQAKKFLSHIDSVS